MKRFFDITVAIFGLVLFLPVLVIIAAAIGWKLQRPIFFLQTRPGLHGHPIKVIKFRTMNEAIDGQGNTLPDSERLSPFGKRLRQYSLDELPELWNVIKGDMSLVGPRPLLMEYLPLYNSEQSRRHDVRPGITGWAQVNGRNSLSWEDKFTMDVWYVDNHSLWLDLKILVMTLTTVVSSKGVTQPGHVSAERFQGNT